VPAILFFSEETNFKIGKKSKRREWLTDVIQKEDREPGQISIILCNDSYLLEMNKQYLNHDYYTDIITFDYSEGDKILSGDLFISVDRVEENASTLAVNFDHELDRVMVHGILHLIGYNDKTSREKSEMRKKEEGYLSLRHY
jgi:rRNA maturation RNase YbeY